MAGVMGRAPQWGALLGAVLLLLAGIGVALWPASVPTVLTLRSVELRNWLSAVPAPSSTQAVVTLTPRLRGTPASWATVLPKGYPQRPSIMRNQDGSSCQLAGPPGPLPTGPSRGLKKPLVRSPAQSSPTLAGRAGPALLLAAAVPLLWGLFGTLLSVRPGAPPHPHSGLPPFKGRLGCITRKACPEARLTLCLAAGLSDFGDMAAAVERLAGSATPAVGPPRSAAALPDRPAGPETHPYRQRHGITVWTAAGGPTPDPVETFDAADLPRALQRTLLRAGFDAPTPIQAQAWGVAFGGADMVAIAKTGSGKTLGFLIPGLRRMAEGGGRGLRVLVLSPTRELAVQTLEEAERFGGPAGFRAVCAYGGASRRAQVEDLRQGCDVLIATPGRLNDFLQAREVDLSSVGYLVLDEADRMLDMGFEPQIRDIVRRLPRQRQTLMFSATWPAEVQQLAGDFLQQPVFVQCGDPSALTANPDIRQNVIVLDSGADKEARLLSLMAEQFRPSDLILVFVARKQTCDVLANLLSRKGFLAAALHGDKEQASREQTLAAFRAGRRPVLVATDVASRGLDVKGVRAVINYDPPHSAEDYVHRIGRTGRAGAVGEAYTFLTRGSEDAGKAEGIASVIRSAGQPVPTTLQAIVDQLLQRRQAAAARDEAQAHLPRVLMVAEKPSVAKLIATHLSGGRFSTRRGVSPGVQVFQFPGWFAPAGERCILQVTSVVGHVFGLDFAAEVQQLRDPAALFEADTQKVLSDTTRKLRIVEHLQALAEGAEYLVLWLDCDAEGENIGFEVIALTQQHIAFDNVYRARFSAVTAPEVKAAFQELSQPDKYAALAVDARQELDLKIGIAFSRLMTRRFLGRAKANFRLRDQRFLSYGPCQTPALWFCVQRHREIQAFQPQQYFDVKVTVDWNRKALELQREGGEVWDAAELRAIQQAVQRQGRGRVEAVQAEARTLARPAGLNTVQLLKACSTGMGLAPAQAMKAAEALYTAGYISYPRTETTAYPATFDLQDALEEQKDHPTLGKTVQWLLRRGRPVRPSVGRDVGDHPPITPTRAARREDFAKGTEWRVYDYIARHFAASLMDDLQYTEKRLAVAFGPHRFQYCWHEVAERGFTFAMPWKFNDLGLNELDAATTLPQAGQELQLRKFLSEARQTRPPDYLRESELIERMDQHRIGTDASIPTHIQNICDRGYVEVCGPGDNGKPGAVIKPTFRRPGSPSGKGKGGGAPQPPASRHMVPRPLGLAVLGCFEELDRELCEPTIRAFMEAECRRIGTGETEKGEVVAANLALFREKFLAFRDRLDQVERLFGAAPDPDRRARPPRGRSAPPANRLAASRRGRSPA